MKTKTRKQQRIDRQIGALLVQHRTALGLTQGQVAKKLRVSTGQVSNYEKGRNNITIDQLIDLASIYGIRIWDILEPVMGGERPAETDCQRRIAGLLEKLSPEGRKSAEGVIRSMAKGH